MDLAPWENILRTESFLLERQFINGFSILANQGEIGHVENVEMVEEKENFLPEDLNHRESLRRSYGASRHLILTHRTLQNPWLLRRRID